MGHCPKSLDPNHSTFGHFSGILVPIYFQKTPYKERKYNFQDTLYGNFVNTSVKAYLYALQQSKLSGDFTSSDEFLNGMEYRLNSSQRYDMEVVKQIL